MASHQKEAQVRIGRAITTSQQLREALGSKYLAIRSRHGAAGGVGYYAMRNEFARQAVLQHKTRR